MDLIRSLPRATLGAEIGVWEGGFSAEILTTPVAQLYLIDAWDHQPQSVDTALHLNQDGHNRNERVVRERFKSEIDSSRVVVIKGYSAQVAKQFDDGFFDWIFLDADHSYEAVKADLLAWENKIKPGGVILGHDYLNNKQANDLKFGVIPAVHEFCDTRGWKLTHLTRDDYWPSYRLERK